MGEEFKVLLPGHEPAIPVTVQSDDTFDVLIQQVKQHKGIPADKGLRIICCGKELFSDDFVSKAGSKVLHCMITDCEPRKIQGGNVSNVDPPIRPPIQHQQQQQQQQQSMDWLDMVDPGTVLMWIFGSILALLWVLFLFCSHTFDRSSIVILCMMTVAFCIPYILSYIPLPAFMQPLIRPLTHPGLPPYDPAMGRSTALPTGIAYMRHPSHGAEYIPPRPPARVRPPLVTS